MRVLVTGGAGFLGSHLCDRLIALGCQVICLDNFFTGSRDNINHLIDHDHFELLHQDVADPISIECDQIYNLACPASPVHYQSDPLRTIRTNVFGIANLLELARESGARILQASTSEVYGDPQQHPQRETYWGNVNCVGLRSCYDEGKRIAETFMVDYGRQHRTEIRIARIFNTYGEKMGIRDGRVVSSLIVQALRNRDMTVYGDGTQTRSFCFVDDLIDGLILLMQAEGFTGPINLGNPQELTINDLAARIIALTGTQSTIVYHPLPSDDPRQRRADISKAKSQLGWEPRIALDEGLKRTIKYFSDKL